MGPDASPNRKTLSVLEHARKAAAGGGRHVE
jgi:hypothetical protein